MSEENVEVVRQPMTVRAQTRRRLGERLTLRFPRMIALLVRAGSRLSPRSQVRKAILRRVAQLCFEAANRADFEAAFSLYDPDVEVTMPPELVSLGFEARYRGREQHLRVQRQWRAEWGEFRFEPEELIDLGDRQLVLGYMRGSGVSSGAAVENQWAILIEISAGRVIYERSFFARDEAQAQALEAAGLSE
jgi:ketosteroid isomerase-like protein